MKTTKRKTKKTKTKTTNRKVKPYKKIKTISKHSKHNKHISRKTIKRSTGGNNGPLNPDVISNTSKSAIMSKQIMIDAKKAVLSIIKERTDAEKNQSSWQTEQGTNNTTSIFDFNLTLPTNQNKYDPVQFWGKLFTANELEQIVDMLKAEVCGEVQKIAPAFEINTSVNFPNPVEELSTGVKVYNINNSMYYAKTSDDIDNIKAILNVDLPEKSKILCATLMIIGILTSKLSSNTTYSILAKGGVATSFALSNLTNGQIHVPINDLDFKIISANNIQDIQTNDGSILATQVCYLIAWLLKSIVSSKYTISVLGPSAKAKQTGYSNIVKLSIKRADGMFIPILDMDFGTNEKNMDYFDYKFRLQGKMPNDTGLEVSYIYPSDIQMLYEKLYYYTLYFWIKTDLTDNNLIRRLRLNPDSLIVLPYGKMSYNKTSNVISFNYNGEILDVASCDRFLEKFKRTILLLVDGMKQTNQTVTQFKTQYENTVNKKIFINTLDRLLLFQIMNDYIEPKLIQLYNMDTKQAPNVFPTRRVNVINSIYPRETGAII